MIYQEFYLKFYKNLSKILEGRFLGITKTTNNFLKPL